MNRTQLFWTARLLLGLILLIGCGSGLFGQLLGYAQESGFSGSWRANFVLGVGGFVLAMRSIGPLIRALNEDARLRREWGRKTHAAFSKATTPRQVFLLLLAVAEADGQAGEAERNLVRKFLLERFVDPVSTADLQSWEAERIDTRDIAGLAHRVARGMSINERATLFTWACLVAFVDERFAQSEHNALQQVANGLGIPAEVGRTLFHLAREQHTRLRGQEPNTRSRPRPRPSPTAGASGGPKFRTQPPPKSGPRDTSAEDPSASPQPKTPREAALATLGLPFQATAEDIRKRHRELVRRFHPDALPNLGPIAQQEAAERFRAIQRAYELLTT
jgi:uncharacterized tellurite resistance protein B-like protein